MNPFQLIGLSVTCSESKYFTTVRRLCRAVVSSLCSALGLQPAASLPRGAHGEPGCARERVWQWGSAVGFWARERAWRQLALGRAVFEPVSVERLSYGPQFCECPTRCPACGVGLPRVNCVFHAASGSSHKFSYVNNCARRGSRG